MATLGQTNRSSTEIDGQGGMGCLPLRCFRRKKPRKKEEKALVVIGDCTPTPALARQLESPHRRWLFSVCQSDPRYQVSRFFDAVGKQRGDDSEDASIFTVWRPTSADAIRRMILGEATGKGLEIKGKSAKAGKLSGFVPFMQIDEEEHKSKIGTIPKGGRVRIFYGSETTRDAVMKELEPYQDHMLSAVLNAKRTVRNTLFSVGGIVGADVAVSTLQQHGFDLAKAGTSAVTSITAATSSTMKTTIKHATSTVSSIGDVMGVDKVVSGAKATSSELGKKVKGAGNSAVTTMKATSSTVQASVKVACSTVSSIGDAMGVDKVVSGARTTSSELGKRVNFSLTSPGGKTAVSSPTRPALPGAEAVRSVAIVSTEKVKLTVANLSNSLVNKKSQQGEQEWAFKRLLWDMDDPSIKIVDTYAPHRYGIELPDRLLWQAFVAERDISRPEGSEYYTGRKSQPAFQDMNLAAIYKTRKNQTKSKRSKGDEPRVVLWHTCDLDTDPDPMDPRGLIMAYEEDGRVLPVVSDFDCFTMGTRGVAYDVPLPKKQIELLQWCVSEIKDVLATQEVSTKSNWTSCWLEVLKENSIKGFHPEIPRFGFGDGVSYTVVEEAVSRLKETGAVRHGAECFNYYFPQELDQEFLIVCSDLSGAPWRYVGVKELQGFIHEKIDQGFTLPLNPKWILCDPGWKSIYDRLLASDRPDVRTSLEVWFPSDSEVRENIESIHTKYPNGFVSDAPPSGVDDTEAMDLAMLELDRFVLGRRVKAKLRTIIAFMNLLITVRRKRAAAYEAGIQEDYSEEESGDESQLDKHSVTVGDGGEELKESEGLVAQDELTDRTCKNPGQFAKDGTSKNALLW